MRVLLLMILAVFSLSVSAQTITATGNVKDATGDPIIGASIVEKGNTSNGTITNLDGDFSLKVPANATLIVSYIGMKTQEIAIKGKNKIDVTLSDDTKALDEVVVIGYGTAKRKDITGSVATVSSEVLSAVPVASATEALQGKMAGVQITTTEGSPDAEMKIRVRGGGSITGDNTPLFIVDGFPVESISDIPASDIEDMTVLKDASSTAIYGSRGANGVILVTTKSGKEGKLSVSYNTYYSWKKMAKTLETLSATDYVKWQREYALLRGNESKFTSLFGNWQDADLYENAPTNDWQDQVFGRTGNTFNHSLTISGGSDKTKFNMGYAHMNDKAIMLGSSFRRDNLSLKLNHKVNDKVSLDFSMRYANTTVNGAGANESKSEVSSADSRMKNVMIYPMFNFPDLSDSYDPDFQLTNPITSVYDTDRKQNRQTFNMNGSFSWEIFKNFKFKTEFGLDWYYNTDKKYYGPSTYNARTNSSDTEGVHPMAYFADTQRKTFRNTNTVNYNFKDIIKNKDHNLNVLVGEETINKKSSLNDDRLSFFPVSFTASQAWALSSQGTPYSVDKYTNADDNLLSYFGRVNYDYQSKYLAEVSFRYDGSSKFAKGHRWGFFPSASVGYRISEESFIKEFAPLSFITNWKLRASYGAMGDDGSSSYQYLSGYDYPGASYVFGDVVYKGLGFRGLPNELITWYKSKTLNVGTDLDLWNGMLSAQVDFFWRYRDGLLGKRSGEVPGTIGAELPEENLNQDLYKGFEIVLGHRNKINDFNYSVSLNFALTRRQNRHLEEGDAVNSYDRWRNKYSNRYSDMGWAYGSNGQFTSMEDIWRSPIQDGQGGATQLPGDWKYEDWNGDGIIDDNDVYPNVYEHTNDNGNPKMTFGATIAAEWKGFDVNLLFQGGGGFNVIYFEQLQYPLCFGGNGLAHFYDRYRQDENGNWIPGKWPTTRDAGSYSVNYARCKQTTYDASYLRLKSVEIGYTIPQHITRKFKVDRLRIFANGYNLFTLSNLDFVDPEHPEGNYGYLYPIMRNFNFGLNLSF